MDMSTKSTTARSRYHPNAFKFVFAALGFMQDELGRLNPHDAEDEDSHHISGRELLDGIRRLGLMQFGYLTTTVFRQWGVHSTGDFGRIVFELIERGEMRKTDRDQLDDFFDIYNFEEVFNHQYQVDTNKAFRD